MIARVETLYETCLKEPKNCLICPFLRTCKQGLKELSKDGKRINQANSKAKKQASKKKR